MNMSLFHFGVRRVTLNVAEDEWILQGRRIQGDTAVRAEITGYAFLTADTVPARFGAFFAAVGAEV